MKRKWFSALLPLLALGVLFAQDPQYQDLEEEDEDLVQETEYVFNPIQAAKELKIGDFYWKKNSLNAAAGRYEEATKWDPGLAEAYWKLGLAREKLAEREIIETEKKLTLEIARSAFDKYLELEPKGNHAKAAQKKVARLGRL